MLVGASRDLELIKSRGLDKFLYRELIFGAKEFLDVFCDRWALKIYGMGLPGGNL